MKRKKPTPQRLSERSTVRLPGNEAKTGYSAPKKGRWVSKSDQLKEIFKIRQRLSDIAENRPDIQACLRRIPQEDLDSLADLMESVIYSLESGTDINPDYYPIH